MYFSPNVNLATVASATDMTTLLARLSAARALGLDYLDQYVSAAEQRKLIAGGPGMIVLPALSTVAPVSGGANVMGAWSQVSAAVPSALLVVAVSLTLASNLSPTYVQVDIGVGAGGAEVVQTKVTGTPKRPGGNDNSAVLIYLPIPLPVTNGVRLAVRCADNSGGDTYALQIVAVDPANVQKWSA